MVKFIVGILVLAFMVLPAGAFMLPTTPQQVTATAGGTAIISVDSGIVTTASLTTAAAANFTLTVQCGAVSASSIVLASVQNGTNTGGTPQISTVDPQNAVVTIIVENTDASAAFNGTIIISFIVFN